MSSCLAWLLLFGIIVHTESRYYCPAKAISSDDSRYYNCIFVSETQTTWLDALSICEDFGGTLAKIRTPDQQDYISKHMTHADYYWFGMNDIQKEAAYVYTDQLPVTWFNWDPRSPQPNGAEEQNCTAVNRRFQWEDKECENKYYYICELHATGQPGAVENVYNPYTKYLDDKSANLRKPADSFDVELMTQLAVEDESFCIMYCIHNPNCVVVAFGPGKTPYNCKQYKTMPGGYAPLWIGWHRYEITD